MIIIQNENSHLCFTEAETTETAADTSHADNISESVSPKATSSSAQPPMAAEAQTSSSLKREKGNLKVVHIAVFSTVRSHLRACIPQSHQEPYVFFCICLLGSFVVSVLCRL